MALSGRLARVRTRIEPAKDNGTGKEDTHGKCTFGWKPAGGV